MPYRSEPWEDLLDDLAGKSTEIGRGLSPDEKTKAKEKAYQNLKALTGQDFGFDVEQWRTWMKQNPDWLWRNDE